LRQKRTKNEVKFDTDLSNKVLDDDIEENFEEPEIEETYNSDNQQQSSVLPQLEVDLLDIIQASKIEAEESINKNEIEEYWNACLLKKLVGDYHEVIKRNVNEDTFYTDFDSLMTGFTKQQFDKYQYQKTYELF
ncbi:9337_t:CDS:2, partial [Diversispora eburnea]